MAYQQREKMVTPASSSTGSSDEELSHGWSKGHGNSGLIDGLPIKVRKPVLPTSTTADDPHGEDTDDASENEDNSDTREDLGISESSRCIKEQMYMMKREELKNALADLEAGNHPAYKKGYKKLDKAFKERLEHNMACRGHEEECIDRYYLEETRAAAREFEEKKSLLKDSLINEYEDLIKRINTERFMELNTEKQEEKPVSTRRLRRRGANDPVPAAEKRRRIAHSLSFRLEEKDVEDDLRSIVTVQQRVSTNPQKKKQQTSSTTTSANTNSSSDVTPINVKVVNGKLFYEKIWFHRGQQVYVNNESGVRWSGLITSINFDHILVKNIDGQEVMNISISDFAKGSFAIHRRA